MKMTELSKVMGEAWKQLSAEEKDEFLKKAEEDKER